MKAQLPFLAVSKAIFTSWSGFLRVGTLREYRMAVLWIRPQPGVCACGVPSRSAQ